MEHNCRQEGPIGALIANVENHDRRIGALEDTTKLIHELNASVKELAMQMKTMNDSFKETRASVQMMEAAPGRAYMDMKHAVAVAIGTGLAGYLLRFILETPK